MRPIVEVAERAGLDEEEIEQYGKYKAKVPLGALERRREGAEGKLILVTAMTPTRFGEGKTTTAIALGQGLATVGKRPMVTLREPSLGPCLGMKGGATGGGKAQVLPAEEINLHFTGDIHAVSAAHNALAAMVDAHLFHGNERKMDPKAVEWRRVVDMNDRALREIVVGLGGRANGVVRETGYDITAASEVMAVLCLAQSYAELRERLARLCVGMDADGQYVTAGELKAAGAMAALLGDALKPNLVQTTEGVPVFVHGGPFANIAHGCNSLVATRLALKLADWVVTEAGFGADLGGEKFFDIKCREGGLRPSAAVVVASLRALRWHGGAAASAINTADEAATARGLENLFKHCENVARFGVPVVVALNRFEGDGEGEPSLVLDEARRRGLSAVACNGWRQGGAGATELAEAVMSVADSGGNSFRPLYPLEMPAGEKMETVAREMYGAEGVDLAPAAEKKIEKMVEAGYRDLPICVAKTQYSLSDDEKLLNVPKGFRVRIRDARLAAGAGFVVMYAGDVMTMPGLPSKPAAWEINLDDGGRVYGLR